MAHFLMGTTLTFALKKQRLAGLGQPLMKAASVVALIRVFLARFLESTTTDSIICGRTEPQRKHPAAFTLTGP